MIKYWRINNKQGITVAHKQKLTIILLYVFLYKLAQQIQQIQIKELIQFYCLLSILIFIKNKQKQPKDKNTKNTQQEMQEQRSKQRCPDLNYGMVSKQNHIKTNLTTRHNNTKETDRDRDANNRKKINADGSVNGSKNKKKNQSEYLLQMYDMYQQYVTRRNKFNTQFSQLPRINRHNSSQILCSLQISEHISQSKPINPLNDVKCKEDPQIMGLTIRNNLNGSTFQSTPFTPAPPSIPNAPSPPPSVPQTQFSPSQNCRRNLRTKMHRTCAQILFNKPDIRIQNQTKIKDAHHKVESRGQLYEMIKKLGKFDQGQAYARICTMRDHGNFMQFMGNIGKWFYRKYVNIIAQNHPNMHPSQLQSIYSANLFYLFYNFDLLFQPRNIQEQECKKDQGAHNRQESLSQSQNQNQYQYQHKEMDSLHSLHSLDFDDYVEDRGENRRSSISDSWISSDNAKYAHQQGKQQEYIRQYQQQQQGKAFGSHISSQSNVNSLNYSKITNLQNMPIFKEQQQYFCYPQAQQQFPAQSVMRSSQLQTNQNINQQVAYTSKLSNSNSNSNYDPNSNPNSNPNPNPGPSPGPCPSPNYNSNWNFNLSWLSSLKQHCRRLVTAPFQAF